MSPYLVLVPVILALAGLISIGLSRWTNSNRHARIAKVLMIASASFFVTAVFLARLWKAAAIDLLDADQGSAILAGIVITIATPVCAVIFLAGFMLWIVSPEKKIL